MLPLVGEIKLYITCITVNTDVLFNIFPHFCSSMFETEAHGRWRHSRDPYLAQFENSVSK